MTSFQVLSTKIIPPRLNPRTLARPRVSQQLKEALNYRLTQLQAGAGFGKSTALATLSEEGVSLIWYQVTEEDRDPLVFLLHLVHATHRSLPGLQNLPIPMLQGWDSTNDLLPTTDILDQYINILEEGLESPVLMVIDDAHLVADTNEIALLLDRMIGLEPFDLHILLATRSTITLPNLHRWKARGEVLSLDQSVLAFTPSEIAALFTSRYNIEMPAEEVDALSSLTEGWAIALQLMWQSLRSGVFNSVEEALAHPATTLESLFDILAFEVFDQQPSDVQEFLRISATLRDMTAEACDILRGATDSAAMLAYLRRQDLFIIDLSDGHHRYHKIFHDFLGQQTTPDQKRKWHLTAAEYYNSKFNHDETIYHLLQGQDLEGAAQLLVAYGADLLASGRLDTLAAHLLALPPEILTQHPTLLFYLGDIARQHSRFEESLGWYGQAESYWREQGQFDGVSRALRAQARVYLDTLNTSKAEQTLQQALRLSDGTADREAQARLYELLAENKINAGDAGEAERLRRQAAALLREGPADSQLLVRVLLRTGRLDEARRQLEALALIERQEPVHTPRAHRETQLLLSIIYAMQGNPDSAYQAAIEGTQRGIEMDSPFVIAVGYMRQGHALMMLPDADRFEEAKRKFEEAIEISRTLAIPRMRVEALWGLCQSFGRQGDLVQASKVAQDGIDLAVQAGDEWIASLVRLAMGANLTLAARYESAADWLGQAARGFQECSDPFGAAASRLWICLGRYHQKESDLVAKTLPDLLSICRQHGYDYLFTHPTLLGPPDERMLVPLLILARDNGWEDPYPAMLLERIGLPDITFHPGYQLRITTLGKFQVWRGDQPIPQTGWRRAKTRQLFQLMLTNRQGLLERDQICEHLWPSMEPTAAQRNFKVALSTLYDVLEPERTPGSDSAYILRDRSRYGLRPGADLRIDVEDFLLLMREADSWVEKNPGRARSLLKQALTLYLGRFLPDARYDTWAAAEREHLEVLFLHAADHYCDLCLKDEEFDEVIDTCQRILVHDNCWERAYRYLMLAYECMGDHGQIARTYQRCVETLKAELDVTPAPETESLYKRLTQTS